MLPFTQVRRSDGIPESEFWLLMPTRCEPRHTATKIAHQNSSGKAKNINYDIKTNRTYQHIWGRNIPEKTQ